MDITALIPLLSQGAGGAIFGPLVGGLLKGQNFGLIGKLLAGIVGGIGAGQGLNALNPELLSGLSSMVGGGDIGSIVSGLVTGGVGGGALSAIVGLVMGGKK